MRTLQGAWPMTASGERLRGGDDAVIPVVRPGVQKLEECGMFWPRWDLIQYASKGLEIAPGSVIGFTIYVLHSRPMAKL